MQVLANTNSVAQGMLVSVGRSVCQPNTFDRTEATTEGMKFRLNRSSIVFTLLLYIVVVPCLFVSSAIYVGGWKLLYRLLTCDSLTEIDYSPSFRWTGIKFCTLKVCVCNVSDCCVSFAGRLLATLPVHELMLWVGVQPCIGAEPSVQY